MADRDELYGRLQAVFRGVFDDDSITLFDAMTAADVEEWDSLKHITLVLAVEREFGIRLKAAEVGALENVGQMADLLQARVA